jgi:hypothetical protein
MARDMVHVYGELPWLRGGPLFRVDVSARPVLDELLERHAFRVVELDGRRMTSMAGAHAELAAAFEFPAGLHGTSWDSFDDWFSEFAERHDGERVAVLWHHVAEAAAGAPATTAEVGWALLGARFRYQPSLVPDRPWSLEMNVFALGEGEEFDRP